MEVRPDCEGCVSVRLLYLIDKLIRLSEIIARKSGGPRSSLADLPIFVAHTKVRELNDRIRV